MSFTPNSPCRILVLHVVPLVRAGIMTSLGQHVPFDVQVSDAHTDDPAAGPIDIVISDYQQAMRQLDSNFMDTRPAFAGCRILIVTDNEREVDIRRAMQAGVHGYVLLKASISDFVEAVVTVANGSRYISPPAAQRMADGLRHEPLTARELEVLKQIVAGEANKAIARRLNINVGTVKTHVRSIFTKLDVTSRTQAANIATTRGLVDAHIAVVTENSEAGPKSVVSSKNNQMD